jgi:putative transcriptional regulator
MDSMTRPRKTATFRSQMSQSMAELRAIMSAGQSPARDGRLTVRTYEVAKPSAYNARKIKSVRSALNVSQAVFARLVGVSDVLVRSWERGARRPALIACRLLDQIRAHPRQFLQFVQTPVNRGHTMQARLNHGRRNGRQAA